MSTSTAAPSCDVELSAAPARQPHLPSLLAPAIGFVVAPILFGLDKFLELARRLAHLPRTARSTTSSPATPIRRCSSSG